MATEKTRKSIVEAFMALAAETPWNEMTLPAIADKAGITLAALRDAYDGKMAILEDFSRRIDMAVLKGGDDDDMAGEPARDRLFDVLMRRLDLLVPYREGLRGLMRSAKRDPLLLAAFNRIAVTSQLWMLSAAGIEAAGPAGMVKAQGLAVAFAKVLRTWLREDDPEWPKTMAALDRELTRGERALHRLDRLACLMPRPFRPDGCRRHRKRHDEEPAASNDDEAAEPAA